MPGEMRRAYSPQLTPSMVLGLAPQATMLRACGPLRHRFGSHGFAACVRHTLRLASIDG